MFNINIVEKQNKKWQELLEKKQKSEAWLHKYKSVIRPVLLSKHDRRITGFAKKM